MRLYTDLLTRKSDLAWVLDLEHSQLFRQNFPKQNGGEVSRALELRTRRVVGLIQKWLNAGLFGRDGKKGRISNGRRNGPRAQIGIRRCWPKSISTMDSGTFVGSRAGRPEKASPR